MSGLGIVNFSLLSWDLFMLGAAYFMITGLLFSFGFLRLFQRHIRSGVLLLIGSIVSTAVFLTIIFKHYV
ncbi:hypothetical protein ACI7RC_12225 [Brevibacillus sp. B_LB10_24]|uniref:hypothetical protein n=1 Tax=Brevibacillus sp. B_LB10_24 TaxID=3380645 RepID=UPI0038B6B850